jgi:hypothetical protein
MKASSLILSNLTRLNRSILAFGALFGAIVIPAHDPVMADTSIAFSDHSNARVKLKQNRFVEKPAVLTWQEFEAEIIKGMRFLNTTYDLPPEFRNGYVYRTQGANWLGAYVLKSGLRRYPTPTGEKLNQLHPDIGERFLQSGDAIYFFWNRGSSVLNVDRYKIRSINSQEACLGATCLTAPGLSNSEIKRILRSERNVQR